MDFQATSGRGCYNCKFSFLDYTVRVPSRSECQFAIVIGRSILRNSREALCMYSNFNSTYEGSLLWRAVDLVWR